MANWSRQGGLAGVQGWQSFERVGAWNHIQFFKPLIRCSPSKPSRPARAYLRVKDHDMLDSLSTAVKQATFSDLKATSRDPCLLGPPSLEFAPFRRVPGNRVRKDGRQGTIDQDPEFIDFLQSMTEPVTKSSLLGDGGDGTDSRPAKVTTTPLVEYLKEKKANKGKEGATPKTSKSQGKSEIKDARIEKIEPKNVPVVRKELLRSPEKARVEKATQEAVRVVNKSVALLKGKKDTAESVPATGKAPVTPLSPIKRERERGSASVAAKILQRELGLAPARERKTSRIATSASKSPGGAEPEAKTTAASPAAQLSNKTAERSTSNVSVQQNTTTPSLSSAPPTGPRISKSSTPSSQSTNKPVHKSTERPPRPSPNPSLGAKSAFLKHANFSQGVTEELLKISFMAFGAVIRCEIDKKKGFGYIDFEDSESLKQAMLASPVKVGDKGGQVVVLENKNLKIKPRTIVEKPRLSEEKVTTQPQTPPATSTKAESVGDAPTTPSTPTAPTAPRGHHVPFRGGSQNQSPRGGLGRGGRGGRASFRGRGALDSNRAAVQANTKTPGKLVATTPSVTPAPKSTVDRKTDGPAA